MCLELNNLYKLVSPSTYSKLDYQKLFMKFQIKKKKYPFKMK